MTAYPAIPAIPAAPLRALAACLLLCALALAGCSQIVAVKGQIDTLDNRALIAGRVVSPPADQGSTVVALLTPEGHDRFNRVAWRRPDDDGTFRFWIKPGTYFLVAFVDSDGDQELKAGERFVYAGENGPSPIEAAAGSQIQVPELVIADLRLPADLPQIDYHQESFRHHLGEVASFNDPAFVRGYYQLGLWRPLDFVAQSKPGIFLLKPYSPGRTPVLLIHGMAGGPLDWISVAPALEQAGLQPFIAYYPTGLDLNMTVDYMTEAIAELRTRFGFDRMHIVAHSMGGLVARTLARSLTRHEQRLTLLSLTTINSPMNGLKSAAAGVNHSWLVIPSWRDVAEGSTFIERLQSWHLPGRTPYYLIFSHRRGSDSDGVVPLESSIPLWLQKDARSMRGFLGNHVDALHNPDTIGFIIRNLTGG